MAPRWPSSCAAPNPVSGHREAAIPGSQAPGPNALSQMFSLRACPPPSPTNHHPSRRGDWRYEYAILLLWTLPAYLVCELVSTSWHRQHLVRSRTKGASWRRIGRAASEGLAWGSALRTRGKRPSISDPTERPWPWHQAPPDSPTPLRLTTQARRLVGGQVRARGGVHRQAQGHRGHRAR